MNGAAAVPDRNTSTPNADQDDDDRQQPPLLAVSSGSTRTPTRCRSAVCDFAALFEVRHRASPAQNCRKYVVAGSRGAAWRIQYDGPSPPPQAAARRGPSAGRRAPTGVKTQIEHQRPARSARPSSRSETPRSSSRCRSAGSPAGARGRRRRRRAPATAERPRSRRPPGRATTRQRREPAEDDEPQPGELPEHLRRRRLVTSDHCMAHPVSPRRRFDVLV